MHPITRRECLPSTSAPGATVLSLGHFAPAGARTGGGKMQSWPLNPPRSSPYGVIQGPHQAAWLPGSGTEHVTVIRIAA